MRRLSDEFRRSGVTGMLFLWKDGQPGLISIEGVQLFPVFSTLEKLREHQDRTERWDYSVKQIDDGSAFIASLQGQIRLIIDPSITPEGNTRFTEVLGDWQETS